MTRQEIEGYLLHAKTSPETFVLDEQADRLEKEIRREVLRARIEELHEWGCCVCDPPPFDGCPTCSRESEFRAELSKLEVPGE